MTDPTQRLDIWIYRCRLLKTRSLATRMILDGKIRITRNGVTERTTKPGFKVRAGDSILFLRGETVINVIVDALPERRGPAPEAQSHYRVIPLDLNSHSRDG